MRGDTKEITPSHLWIILTQVVPLGALSEIHPKPRIVVEAQFISMLQKGKLPSARGRLSFVGHLKPLVPASPCGR